MRSAYSVNRQVLARRSSRRGIATVEFGVLAPLLVLLVLGSIDVGQFANVYQKVSDASREGARFAVQYETTSESQVKSAVMSYLQTAFPDVSASTLNAAVTITVSNAAGSPIPEGNMTLVPTGSQVGVTVTVPYGLLRWIQYIPSLGGSEVTVTTMMRRE